MMQLNLFEIVQPNQSLSITINESITKKSKWITTNSELYKWKKKIRMERIFVIDTHVFCLRKRRIGGSGMLVSRWVKGRVQGGGGWSGCGCRWCHSGFISDCSIASLAHTERRLWNQTSVKIISSKPTHCISLFFLFAFIFYFKFSRHIPAQ